MTLMHPSMEKFESAVNHVCRAYRVDRAELLGASKKRRAAWPRQVLYYVLRERYGWVLTEIGHHTQRDHSTVTHGINFVRSRLGGDREERDFVAEIMSLMPEPPSLVSREQELETDLRAAVAELEVVRDRCNTAIRRMQQRIERSGEVAV